MRNEISLPHLKIGSIVLAVIVLAISPHFNNLKENFEMFKLESVRQNCLKLSDTYKRELCLKPYFTQLTMIKGPYSAMAQAVDLKNKGLMNPCHIAAHYIGNANLERNNNDVGKALSSCPESCGEGCFHGVIEKYSSNFPSFETAIQTVPKYCDNIKDPWYSRQCYHGLGHGIVEHSPNDLNQGVKFCTNVTQGQYDNQTACLGGMFMEYSIEQLPLDLTNSDLARQALTKKIPTLCDQSKTYNNDRVFTNCIQRLGGALTFFTGNNVDQARAFCDHLKTDDEKSMCKDAAESEGRINSKF